jgi:hypothetical protein
MRAIGRAVIVLYALWKRFICNPDSGSPSMQVGGG